VSGGGGLITDGSAPSFSLYVNKSGNDANPCSILLPCLTIARAMLLVPTLTGQGPLPDTFGTFVEIYVGGGTYAENVVLQPYVGLVAQEQSTITVAIDGTITLSSSWNGADAGITGVALSVVDGFSITGDVTVAPSGTGGAEVFFYNDAIAGNLTVTGNTNTNTNVGIYQTVVDSAVSVSGAAFYSAGSQLGDVTIASTASTSALWGSASDALFDGAVTVTSAAGHTATAFLQTSQLNETSLTLTGSGTTYSATAGGIPSTVTLTSSAPAPVPLSPLIGLNSKIAAGTNATNLYYPAANGSGGIAWTAPPTGGITQLTGPVTAGPGSGSVADTLTLSGDCTVSGSAITCTQAQTGAETFGTQGQIACASGDTTCSLSQASESSATKGSDLVIQPQPSTHTTDNGSGNAVVVVGIPNGAGVEGRLDVGRGIPSSYSTVASISGYPGLAPGYGGMWFGASSGASATTANAAFLGSGTTTQLNAPTAGTLYFSEGGYTATTGTNVTTAGWTFGTSQALTTGGIIHIQGTSSVADILTFNNGNGLGVQAAAYAMPAAGGTPAAAVTQYPIIRLGIQTTSAGATLTLPNVAGGFWWIDITNLTLTNALTIKSGTGTCGTSISSLTAVDQVVEVITYGANTCVLNQ
jgi:hypothetical protein